MSSNLHKDLSDSQLHVPKGFVTASNSTTLTKNASGNLEWATSSGGGNDTVGQSWNGCVNYVAPKESKSAVNWLIRQINCGSSFVASDNQHATDTGSALTTFAITGDRILGGTVKTMGQNKTLTEFNGNLYSAVAGTMDIAIFKGTPNCETQTLESLVLIDKIPLTLKLRSTTCFAKTLNVAMLKGEVIVPAVLMGGSNGITYSANLLFS